MPESSTITKQTTLSSNDGCTDNWIDRLSLKLVRDSLSRLCHGTVYLEYQGETHRYGSEGQCDLQVDVKVKDARAFRMFAFGGSVGAAEAYMQGYWTSSDLVAVVRLFSRNISVLNQQEGRWSWLGNQVNRWVNRRTENTVEGSRRNIAAHYDLSNDFFQLFLDPTLMYSAAVYPQPSSSLEQAALYKLDLICQKLELRPDDHLLEIGTGWGGMAIYAAKNYGCKVTTTTISEKQYQYARERVEAEGLGSKITLLKQDYRHLQGSYSKLVSIEMIEAVGHEYFDQYFSQIGRLLKPGGKMLLQAITVPDQRYDVARRNVDFIKKYIFPGGALPSIGVITRSLATQTDLMVTQVEDIGLHYAQTLRQWCERFEDNLHLIVQLGFNDEFCRMWKLYLNYCEGGFRERVISTVQLVSEKPAF